MRHWSVNAIAAEIGFSNHTVNAAFRRHGLAQVSHASKRHAARQRAEPVAARLGYATIADYIDQCRAQGRTWKAGHLRLIRPAAVVAAPARGRSGQSTGCL
jgi:hypothetical protein